MLFFLSLIAFVFSILSKAQAVILPFVLILVDMLIFKNALSRKNLLQKIPHFIISLIFGGLAIYIQKKSGAVQDFEYFSFFTRILFSCYGFVQYLSKLVLPINLSCFYPYPETNDKINSNWVYVAPFIILALASIIYKLKKRDSVWIFGLLFFVVTIGPVLQLIPVGDAIIADRYTYLPYIGLFIIIAHEFEKLKWRTLVKNTTICAIAVVLLFLSFNRILKWKDNITLYTDSLKKYPAPIIYNNLGAAYAELGDYKKALPCFTELVKLKSRYPSGYKNRAITNHKLSNYDAAVADYTEAIKQDPTNLQNYLSRGDSYKTKNDFTNAIKDFDYVLSKDSNNIDAYYSRGESLGKSGKMLEALNDYNIVIRRKPNYAEAYSNRGIVNSILTNYTAAIADFTKSIELKADGWSTYMNRSIALKSTGNYTDALKDALVAQKNGYNVDPLYIEDLQKMGK
ncbi:MAG: tetratricopeptide repeat protein [Bacteroidetes bacterium]|nr:tetratricopeptide repeat protein [Bacteroidota bacterium]